MKPAHPVDYLQIFTNTSGTRLILSGNEAYARGLFEAGVTFFSNYPGTPTSEIGDAWYELSKQSSQFQYDLAINETVAFEEAIGAAWMGVRSGVAFKHLGMNLISDALHTVMYSGIDGKRKAGCVIICGGDPDIGSSTNGEDIRLFALHAKIPILEPATVQECRDFVIRAFELSELWQIPVMIYSPTGLNHASSIVELKEPMRPPGPLNDKPLFVKQQDKFLNAIHWARKNQAKLNRIMDEIENCPLKKIPPIIKSPIRGKIKEKLTKREHKQDYNQDLKCQVGFVTSGIYWTYLEEICNLLGKPLPRLRLLLTFPIIKEEILDFIEEYELDTLIVIEESEPFIEDQIKTFWEEASEIMNLPLQIFGKKLFPREGSPTPEKIIAALGFPHTVQEASMWFKDFEALLPKIPIELKELQQNLPIREPTFCPGCSHRNVFYALRRAANVYQTRTGIESIFGGDIGCYTMSMSAPYQTMDWLICMGAGVGIANGIGRLIDVKKQQVIAMIGDSTFFHSGIQPIINLAKDNVSAIVLILDNYFCAMTGDQLSPSTPTALRDNKERTIDIQKIIEALGDFPITNLDGYSIKAMQKAFEDLMPQKGLRFVIVKAECALNKKRRIALQKQAKKSKASEIAKTCIFINDHCVKCDECFSRLGCTAIQLIDNKYQIDETRCMGEECQSCIEICPNHAIYKTIINSHLKKKEIK